MTDLKVCDGHGDVCWCDECYGCMKCGADKCKIEGCAAQAMEDALHDVKPESLK